MAKMYLPVIAPKDYEAFAKILRDEIPSNYAEWRRDVDKWQAVHRPQQDTIIEVEISPNSFADYLRQNDYAPGLKRLVGFAAYQGDRPWRLTDLTFAPAGDGRDRATINGVEVIRENGRYWIITPSGPIWSNIDQRGVDPALNYLFGKKRQQQEQSSQ